MKTILVPTDFSPAAMNATFYAAQMAAAIKANILLLHVYEIPFTYTEIPVPIDHELMIRDTEMQLFNVREQLATQMKDTVEIMTEVRNGAFFNDLKAVCERVKPYAVVMGSQGRSSAQHFLFGSNTVYAMKHLTWPMIAVPIGVKFERIRRIGLACDLEQVTATVPMDELKTLVDDFNASLFIINVGKEKDFDHDLVFETQLLQIMLKELQPTYHFISAKDKNQGIIEFAEENKLDMLIVLPKPHDLMYKLTHSSHTTKLVLHCHVPVIALHHTPA